MILLCKRFYSSFDQNSESFDRVRFVWISKQFDIQALLSKNIYDRYTPSVYYRDLINFYSWKYANVSVADPDPGKKYPKQTLPNYTKVLAKYFNRIRTFWKFESRYYLIRSQKFLKQHFYHFRVHALLEKHI